jgi:hypothetical protein
MGRGCSVAEAIHQALPLDFQVAWVCAKRAGAMADSVRANLIGPFLVHGALQMTGMPANLLQAQRDYFGAHTYERVDQPRGQFYHLDWPEAGRPQYEI